MEFKQGQRVKVERLDLTGTVVRTLSATSKGRGLVVVETDGGGTLHFRPEQARRELRRN